MVNHGPIENMLYSNHRQGWPNLRWSCRSARPTGSLWCGSERACRLRYQRRLGWRFTPWLALFSVSVSNKYGGPPQIKPFTYMTKYCDVKEIKGYRTKVLLGISHIASGLVINRSGLLDQEVVRRLSSLSSQLNIFFGILYHAFRAWYDQLCELYDWLLFLI
jgi:hypothetical protein